MKRKSNIFIICILSIAATLALAGGIYMKVFGSRSKDITTIGGSDGPTAIFIAGKVGQGGLLLLIFSIFILVVCVFFFIRYIRNKNN